MRAFQHNKVFQLAVITLLLIFAVAGTLQAQIFPLPAAVPPAPAIVNPFMGTVSPGYDILGFIEYASVDGGAAALCTTPTGLPVPLPNAVGVAPAPLPAGAPLTPGCKTAGGWIEINNTVIRVPANVIVVLPNTYMTWEELFENNPGAVMCTAPGTPANCTYTAPVPGETGLAMSDKVHSPFTFEAHVQGQIVNGQYMAGLIFLSQQSGNFHMGFIEAINYADGSLTIAGTRVQLNDQTIQMTDANGNAINKGRYSIGQSPDIRFTVDQGNPTVVAQTGYPLCIPRVPPGTYPAVVGAGVSPGVPDPYVLAAPAGFTFTGFDDPQCPEINRPRDATVGFSRLLQNFTMNAPGGAPTADNLFPQDPFTEVPFEVGDFVTMIGTQFQDSNPASPTFGQPYISATEVVDNLGVYTAAGIDPAYVYINVLLQGTGGLPDPAFPQEAARRTKVEGMTTDPLRNIDVSAVDIDPCGNLTFRLPTWVSNFPVEQGLPLVGKKGRWRFRPNGGTFLPPVQNVGATTSGGFVGVQNNGLVFDYYQLPIPEFIFPEDLVPGNFPPAFNFQDLPFLVNGVGPWPTPGSILDSQLIQLGAKRPEVPQPDPAQFIGQLNPWPDSKPAPAATTCNAGNANAAHAVASFTAAATPITAGTLVTLSSTGSTPSNGPFLWTQIVNPGDPVITINNPTSATATFAAPVVAAPLNLSIQLTVGGGNASTPSIATLAIPINVPPAGTPPAVFGSATPNPALGDGITIVNLIANGVDPSGGTLSFAWTQVINPGDPAVAITAANTANASFVTPLVPATTAPIILTFKVTATSTTVGLAPASTLVTVQINPVADLITVSHVRYIKGLARLVINASDFTPGVTLTVTLAGRNGESPTINPATGQPYTGVMGPVIPFAPGVFTIRLTNVPAPDLVTIRSSAGGIVTSGVTITR